MSRIEKLEGASIALVAMGESQLDFHLSKSHSVEFDEVWGINAMVKLTLKKVLQKEEIKESFI